MSLILFIYCKENWQNKEVEGKIEKQKKNIILLINFKLSIYSKKLEISNEVLAL